MKRLLTAEMRPEWPKSNPYAGNLNGITLFQGPHVNFLINNNDPQKDCWTAEMRPEWAKSSPFP